MGNQLIAARAAAKMASSTRTAVVCPPDPSACWMPMANAMAAMAKAIVATRYPVRYLLIPYWLTALRTGDRPVGARCRNARLPTSTASAAMAITPATVIGRPPGSGRGRGLGLGLGLG